MPGERVQALVRDAWRWWLGDQPATYRHARWLFLRLLGVVYLVAFASLAVQVRGLIGAHGLLPAAPMLQAIRSMYGAAAYRAYPTIFWFGAGDLALSGACWAGVVLAVLLIADIAPMPVLVLLWMLYLSLSSVGQDFLSFQWDTLLLEAGLLAVLYAPGGWWPRRAAREPSAVARWLVLALLFKLMFLSGVTKLLSGDPTWSNLSALDYHFLTQPLPPWTAWYADHVPHRLHALATLGMYGAELVAPWLIFAPPRWRRPRFIAFIAIVGFQLSIAATGNYGFFNLLAIVLCVPLLDDGVLDRVFRRSRAALPAESYQRRAATAAAAGLIGLMSTAVFVQEMVYTVPHRQAPSLGVIGFLANATRPLRSINGYGLFRVMTTERDEIVVEGSGDGQTWREYEFSWKPGDVTRRPRFVEPYHPRLDWQMWFAALDPQGNREWLQALMQGLLEGRPEILGLLGTNPFPDKPPTYVRLVYYRYRFTSSGEKHETGAWWKRDFIGYLTAPYSL